MPDRKRKDVRAVAEAAASLGLSWISGGPGGGGGVDAEVVAKGNDIFQSYDVAGIQHIPADHPELAHKCNAGLANRHVASLTRTKSGKVLAGMGTIGSSTGCQMFDPETHRWGTLFNGSRFISLMSQNSDPTGPDGWPNWAIGHRYVRSNGELVVLDENTGTLIGGEFGFDLGKAGITTVKSDGSPYLIPSTERWAVRNLIQQDEDGPVVFASVWTGGMIKSPGGLWKVDTSTGQVDRLLNKQVEGSAQRGNNIVAVTKNEGVFLSSDGGASFSDISANLPKSTWWRCTNMLKNGTILVGGCFPEAAAGGWCWARRKPGETEWENLSAVVDNRDLTSGQEFTPPNTGNRMGAPGCTIIATKHVMYEGQLVPTCSGAGGVAWLYLEDEGGCRPMAFGGGVVVNRDVVASTDGQHILLAMMDHKVQASHDGGMTWDKEASGLGGPNDFQAAGFDKANNLFLAMGDDGSRWESPIANPLKWKVSAKDARQFNPGSPRVGGSGAVVTLDGVDVADGALERFGVADIKKRHLTGGKLWVIGHGAIYLPVS